MAQRWRAAMPWLVGTVSVVLASLLLTRTAVFAAGWPYNHEYLSPFQRTEQFRRALLAGDLLPVWSPFAHNGHGTPAPLFYHRLFYLVSGGFAIPFGTQAAVRIALLFFLALGGVGMIAAARRLGAPWLHAIILGCYLPAANYTLTDWLVRGAMAEFSAMMLLPWVFLFAAAALSGSRRTEWFGLSLALLFHAHSVIFLFVVPFAAAVLVTRVVGEIRRREWRRSLVGLARFAAPGAVLVILPALAVIAVAPAFSLEVTTQLYSPQRELKPLALYWSDPGFAWAAEWRSYSVEIGKGLLLGAGALLALAGALAWRRLLRRTELWIFVATTGAAFLLQTRLAVPLYDHVIATQFLQFPWRLLGLITVGLLAVIAACVAELAGPGWPGAVAGAILAAVLVPQLVFASAAQATRVEFASAAEVQRTIDALDGPISAGEYLPRGMSARSVPPRADFLVAEGCSSAARLDGRPLSEAVHFRSLTIRVESPRGCLLRCSQFFTPLVVVSPGTLPVAAAADGTTTVAVPAGGHEVRLRILSLAELAALPFERRRMDRSRTERSSSEIP